MKPIQIVGALLIVAGIFVLWQRPSFATRKNVIEVGDFKASVDEREAVPPWVGVVGIVAGVALLFAGGRKSS